MQRASLHYLMQIRPMIEEIEAAEDYELDTVYFGMLLLHIHIGFCKATIFKSLIIPIEEQPPT